MIEFGDDENTVNRDGYSSDTDYSIAYKKVPLMYIFSLY